MTDKRETRLQRAMDETTTSGAIDRALAHYLADRRTKAVIADELATKHVEALSTLWLTIERDTRIIE